MGLGGAAQRERMASQEGSVPEGACGRREDAERRRISRSADETRGPDRVTANLHVLRLRTHQPPPPGRPPAMPSEKGTKRGGGDAGGGPSLEWGKTTQRIGRIIARAYFLSRSLIKEN